MSHRGEVDPGDRHDAEQLGRDGSPSSIIERSCLVNLGVSLNIRRARYCAPKLRRGRFRLRGRAKRE